MTNALRNNEDRRTKPATVRDGVLQPSISHPAATTTRPGRDIYYLTADQVQEAMRAWLATQGVRHSGRVILTPHMVGRDRDQSCPWLLFAEDAHSAQVGHQTNHTTTNTDRKEP